MSANSGAKYAPQFHLLKPVELKALIRKLDAALLDPNISISYRNRCRRNLDLIADELATRYKKTA